MVQQELHPSDEGQQGDGNPGEPVTDETAPGVSEALIAEAVEGAPAYEPPAVMMAEGDALAVPPAPEPLEPTIPAVSLSQRVGYVFDEAFAWVKTLVSAAVYATLIVTFGFQVARVEGQSMAPTLENQDRLIVNKFEYLFDAPRPGDIVMMRYPADPDKSFVKRVIAREGDAVRIEDGTVYVNGRAMADDFVLPDYRDHQDHETQIIPKGYYYVLGDHRNNSSDSREWGVVPKKYIMGKVQLRWWPIPNARVF